MVKFLDYEGLSHYDELIKKLIKTGDSELLTLIQEVKDSIEGSDADSVDSKIADLKDLLDEKAQQLADDNAALEGRVKDIEDGIDGKIDEAIAEVVDGAPEAFDTLREIAQWIASDEAGVADLVSKVAANEQAIADNKAAIDEDVEKLSQHLDAAAEAYAKHDDRLAVVEAMVGVEGNSEGESLAERIETLETLSHEEPGSIEDEEIDALFA